MNQTRRQNYFQAHQDVMQFLNQARAMRSALVKRLYCTDVCCEWPSHLRSSGILHMKEKQLPTKRQERRKHIVVFLRRVFVFDRKHWRNAQGVCGTVCITVNVAVYVKNNVGGCVHVDLGVCVCHDQ